MIRIVFALVVLLAARLAAAEDPLFDLDAIQTDPLDAVVLKSSEADGIVTEEIEYTSDGERIAGILAYPKSQQKLPAVFWSQGGMSPASTYFPHVFARKGYFCLNITLPVGRRDGNGAFDTNNPRAANLTRLAIDQMRGITYLAGRAEVDADRIGVGGSSYGGVFATLIAGADPRVKAGMSFFAGGNHHLGTNLPQFTQLAGARDVEIWKTTIDPAWRLKTRRVPFLWAAAANDNWFHLPAVVQTYVDAAGPKHLAIVPTWQHGFPEHVDQQLIDWFDIWLNTNRSKYNDSSALTVKLENGVPVARWSWSGDNAVRRADLVVAYGPAMPWHSWVYRHHEIVPATIDGSSARAAVPVPEPDLPAYVYGNVIDERGVVSSTIPLVIVPSQLGTATANPSSMNCFPIGKFEADDIDFLQRHGYMFGAADQTEKHAGKQSIRLDPTNRVNLWHIPGRGHTLRLWLKSDRPATVRISVDGIAPPNWGRPVVDALRRAHSNFESVTAMPAYHLEAQTDGQWREFVLSCPIDERFVEGYSLTVAPGDGVRAWMDSVRFEPHWRQ